MFFNYPRDMLCDNAKTVIHPRENNLRDRFQPVELLLPR
jgi:hypothetical protein